MLRLISVVFLVACLLVLSACQQALPTPMLEIQGQSIQDSTVTIKAAIDKPGWLVFRPATPQGEPDTSKTLQHAYIPAAGEYAEINMTLTGTIVGETTVFAMLHYDDPADEQFTAAADNTDDPPVMVGGMVVEDSFTMHGISPFIEVQDVAGNAVTIKVAIDESGWLVFRPATPEGEPDTSTMLTYAYFKAAGEYTNISIELPDTLAEGATVFAILHYDDPADKQFTFSVSGTHDPPVEVEGTAITKSFEMSG